MVLVKCIQNLCTYSQFFVCVSLLSCSRISSGTLNSSLFPRLPLIQLILVRVIKLSLAELSLISKSFRFGSVVSLVLFFLKVLSAMLEQWATTVDRSLLTLKAIVDRNANFHCWEDSGSSESYSYRGKKVADPPERETLNVADPHFSQCGGPTCEEE